MRISPLDLRQQRFRTALRGYDRTEVVAFLTEAADDYEHALREIDRMRGDLAAHGGAARRASRARGQPAQHDVDGAAARGRDQGIGAERSQADRPRSAGARRPAASRRRRAGSKRSIATSTSSGCAGATSKDRSRPRSSRSTARSSSSAIRIRIGREEKVLLHRPRQADAGARLDARRRHLRG